jgi:hypothetical protein
MWNVEVILGLYLFCEIPAFIFHFLVSLSNYIHCNFMHWIQWLYYCYKHLDKSCILNLASAACDHFLILNFFTVSANLSYKKEAHHLWVTQLFLKSVHINMILLCLSVHCILRSCVKLLRHDPTQDSHPFSKFQLVTHTFPKIWTLICDIFSSVLLMDGYSECSALVTDVTQIWNVENQIFEFFPLFPPCKQVSMSCRRFL